LRVSKASRCSTRRRNAELAAALARLAAEQAALRASLPAHRQETIDAVLGKVRAELPDYRREIIETTLSMTRAEYTVMPRFGFHQPLDYREDSVPEPFGDAVWREGEALPLPAPEDRFGYPADDDTYLRMGATDAAMFKAQIARHAGQLEALAILDFGCSSGRVLRHFETERREQAWRLHGVDIQARAIEWLRLHFPPHYGVATTTVLPHLPFEDNSLDIIYGISVFTHIKYLWDMWLLELRRVLRPGGLLLQTIHTENAWAFYHRNREAEWVRRDHAALIAEAAEMPHDWMHHGDIAVSQAFWKRDIARRNWGRYLEVLDLLPPQHEMSFQDLMVCRKPPA
jgi:SAM-dependent methyltransferase